jgi:hypothetical protein
LLGGHRFELAGAPEMPTLLRQTTADRAFRWTPARLRRHWVSEHRLAEMMRVDFDQVS